jgi:hypothetical protein
VGLALKHTSDELRPLFHEFSKYNMIKYDEDSCDEYWDNFKTKDDQLGIGTLIYWAKEEDPLKATTIMNKYKQKELYLQSFHIRLNC